MFWLPGYFPCSEADHFDFLPAGGWGGLPSHPGRLTSRIFLFSSRAFPGRFLPPPPFRVRGSSGSPMIFLGFYKITRGMSLSPPFPFDPSPLVVSARTLLLLVNYVLLPSPIFVMYSSVFFGVQKRSHAASSGRRRRRTPLPKAAADMVP